jgi:hypothetical protein
MNSALSQFIKNASPEELVKIYFIIEPKVLPFVEKEARREALDDLRQGRVYEAKNAKEVLQKCLE